MKVIRKKSSPVLLCSQEISHGLSYGWISLQKEELLTNLLHLVTHYRQNKSFKQICTLYRRCGFTCMITVLTRHPCFWNSSTSLSIACTNSASRISDPQTCRSTFVYGCSLSQFVMAVTWLTLHNQQSMLTVMSPLVWGSVYGHIHTNNKLHKLLTLLVPE